MFTSVPARKRIAFKIIAKKKTLKIIPSKSVEKVKIIENYFDKCNAYVFG